MRIAAVWILDEWHLYGTFCPHSVPKIDPLGICIGGIEENVHREYRIHDLRGACRENFGEHLDELIRFEMIGEQLVLPKP